MTNWSELPTDTYNVSQRSVEQKRQRENNRAVTRYVVGRAHDVEDCRLLLDVLGLDPREAR